MATITALQALRLIREQEKPDLIYVFGTEDALKQEITQLLRKKVLAGDQAALNYFATSSEALSFDQLYQLCCTLPLFAPAKMVVVYDFERIFKNKELREEWQKVLSDKPGQTHLVLWGKKLPDRRVSLYKWLAQRAWLVNCAPLTPKDVQRWLRQTIKKEGMKMSLEARQVFQQRVGTSLYHLRNEMEKLISFAQDKKTITVKDVEQVIIPSLEANIFNYVDALGRRQTPLAWQTLRNMLLSGEPALRIFAMIVRQYRLLLQIALLQEKQEPPFVIGQKLKLPDFILRKLLEQTRFFALKDLQKMFIDLITWEGQIKSGEIDAAMALELLTLKNC